MKMISEKKAFYKEKSLKKKVSLMMVAFISAIFLTFFSILVIRIIDEYRVMNGSIIVICAVFIVFFVSVSRKFNEIFTDGKIDMIDKIFYIMFAIMVIGQMCSAFFLKCKPVTDLRQLDMMAKSVAQTGDFSKLYNNMSSSVGYIARYQNNLFSFLFLAVVYRISFLTVGSMSNMIPTIINIIAISSSIFILYKIVKKIMSPKKAFIAFLLCFFFLPYYTYVPYYYTDSLSMPFVMLSIYLFIIFNEKERKFEKIKWMFFTMTSVFFGFAIKGSVIILTVGFVMYLFTKYKLKYVVAFTVACVVFILSMSFGLKQVSYKLGVTSEQELYKEQYPTTHWLMMGLKGVGGYSDKDRQFTREAGNYDEKKEATINEMKKRLKDYGVIGFLKHLIDKADYTWKDGTYYIRNHLSNTTAKQTKVRTTILGKYDPSNNGKNLSDNNNKFVIVSNAYQLMILLLLIIALFSSVVNPSLDFLSLLKILFLGVSIFFLIWETRSRYLFNFTAVFLIIGAESIEILNSFSLEKLKRGNIQESIRLLDKKLKKLL